MAAMPSEQPLLNESGTTAEQLQSSDVIWTTFGVFACVFLVMVFVVGVCSNARSPPTPEDVESGNVSADIGRTHASRHRSYSGSPLDRDKSLYPTRHCRKDASGFSTRSKMEPEDGPSQPERSLQYPHIKHKPVLGYREQTIAAEEAFDFQVAAGKEPDLPRSHGSPSGDSEQKAASSSKRDPRFTETFDVTGNFESFESVGAHIQPRAKTSAKFTPDPIHPVAPALEVHDVRTPGRSRHASSAHEQQQYMMAGALQPVSRPQVMLESDDIVLNAPESEQEESEEWENFDAEHQRDSIRGSRASILQEVEDEYESHTSPNQAR